MTVNLGMATWLGLFGLLMALVELYVPDLSVSLEKSLRWLQSTSADGGEWLKYMPGRLHSWVMETAIGRLYASAWLVLVPGGVIGGLYLIGSNHEILGSIPFLIGAAPVVYRYLLNYLYLFSWIPRAVFLVFDKVMLALNFAGRGKALSGVGLVLAFYGLIDPLLQV